MRGSVPFPFALDMGTSFCWDGASPLLPAPVIYRTMQVSQAVLLKRRVGEERYRTGHLRIHREAPYRVSHRPWMLHDDLKINTIVSKYFVWNFVHPYLLRQNALLQMHWQNTWVTLSIKSLLRTHVTNWMLVDGVINLWCECWFYTAKKHFGYRWCMTKELRDSNTWL